MRRIRTRSMAPIGSRASSEAANAEAIPGMRRTDRYVFTPSSVYTARSSAQEIRLQPNPWHHAGRADVALRRRGRAAHPVRDLAAGGARPGAADCPLA